MGKKLFTESLRNETQPTVFCPGLTAYSAKPSKPELTYD